MKTGRVWLGVTLVVVCVASCANAGADIDGVKLGKWTMDIDAAKVIAKQKKLPILLNFSGSDWCGWCQLMERNVFSKKEWEEYAKSSVVTVVLDFPKDSSIVPAKYVERNKGLKEHFGVAGFPTFVLLDSDGETELGRLGASRDVTPEAFIRNMEALCRYSEACVANYAKGLSKRDRQEYMRIIKEISACKDGLKESKDRIAEEKKRTEELEKKAEELKVKAGAFRATRLGEKEAKEYKELKAQFDAARKELEAWIETSPERSDANMKKYQSMSKRMQELADKLSVY